MTTVTSSASKGENGSWGVFFCFFLCVNDLILRHNKPQTNMSSPPEKKASRGKTTPKRAGLPALLDLSPFSLLSPLANAGKVPFQCGQHVVAQRVAKKQAKRWALGRPPDIASVRAQQVQDPQYGKDRVGGR
jgi:hypothetical protein